MEADQSSVQVALEEVKNDVEHGSPVRRRPPPKERRTAVMRKPYQKPMLYVEHFELSEHIAIGCKLLDTDGQKNVLNPYQCTMDYGGMVLFTTEADCGMVNGAIVMDPDGPDSMTCYHGPSPDRVVFGS